MNDTGDTLFWEPKKQIVKLSSYNETFRQKDRFRTGSLESRKTPKEQHLQISGISQVNHTEE